MTKKAQAIIFKFKERVNAQMYLYHNNIIDFSKLQDKLNDETHKVENMITTMFYYDLLSEKDFLEMYVLPSRIVFNEISEILGIEPDTEDLIDQV